MVKSATDIRTNTIQIPSDMKSFTSDGEFNGLIFPLNYFYVKNPSYSESMSTIQAIERRWPSANSESDMLNKRTPISSSKV